MDDEELGSANQQRDRGEILPVVVRHRLEDEGTVTKLSKTTITVCPSGAALATISVPMMPFAPARLSTTKGLPSASVSGGARSRATTSVAPPGRSRHQQPDRPVRIRLRVRSAAAGERETADEREQAPRNS